MSKSLKKRFISAFGFAIVNFIVFSIMYKFILFREDWLSFSIIWSISWAMGRFISQCILALNKPLKFNIIIDVLTIITLFLFLTSSLAVFIFFKFITLEAILNIIVPFGVSILYTSIVPIPKSN